MAPKNSHLLLHSPVEGVQCENTQLGVICAVSTTLQKERRKFRDVMTQERDFL